MSFRSLVIALVDSSLARAIFLRSGTKHPMVRRFVAGEQLADALETVSDLGHDGIEAALDYLGENLVNPSEIEEAMQQYIEVVRALSTFYRTAHVSVKLSAMGLLLSPELARENLRRLLEWAHERGGIFVRVDMESSVHTQQTIDIVRDMHSDFPDVGAVIQSYLRRSDNDIELLNASKIPVRLVKGAYAETPIAAYTLKQDVDRQFRKQMFQLLESGTDPAIATHDPKLIADVKMFVRRQSIPPDRFSFELLMGVRRDIQTQLKAEGYRVRVYVPYGAMWYPYFTRRLAERPANVGFLVRNLSKG